MDNKKTILIVEDDFFVSRAYAIKFEKENLNVQSVTDGEAAIDYLKKNEAPNLVLLDLMIPKKSGFEVLKEIKENEKWKNIPVIILSNLGQESDIKKGKEMGAAEYIIKADVDIEEIIKKSKKYM
ncbi:response regulator [Candidatus Wolfebacteria bacterium CG02_land_8_20_14_3_00_37_12]|uniref:Response regulator n=2 Tax=Candidatus Wolfeibacteriota TaxID=1752735 RepID=A0A2M7Q965_9BACT|nr:MAG: response regulator [Candidatus Wolfebacteria bacterium CG02_land_8_20_14_3_00_37_12]PIY59620.1 MAG: response regulator [Candidatus Wolfebacteria bacterium CG_4_10_14_0_8_um_filter_37_11]